MRVNLPSETRCRRPGFCWQREILLQYALSRISCRAKAAQDGTFRLISDHVIQKGPSFETPLESFIDATTGKVTTSSDNSFVRCNNTKTDDRQFRDYKAGPEEGLWLDEVREPRSKLIAIVFPTGEPR